MTKKLTDVLTRLAADKKFAEAFQADKRALLQQQGLDDAQIEMIINKDYDAIRKALGSDYDISTNDIIRAYKK